MTREELLRSPYYWQGKIQAAIYRQAVAFMESHRYNRSELAHHLGVSKSYVTQLLSGDYNFSIEKLCELSLKLGVAPVLDFDDVDEIVYGETIRYSVAYPVQAQPAEAIKGNRYIQLAA